MSMDSKQTQQTARFYDGSSAVAWQARAQLAANGLIISGEGPTLVWPLESLRVIAEFEKDQEIHIGSDTAPDARLVVQAGGFRDALKVQAPRAFRRGGTAVPSATRSFVRWFAAAGVALAILAALGWLSPSFLARHIPWSWEQGLGEMSADMVLEVFGGRNPRLCRGEAGRAVLEDLAERLVEAGGIEDPLHIEVYDLPIENAFAVSGGRIYIFKGLLDFVSGPDELAGVLAHELGHIRARDSTAQLIRVHGLSLLAELFSGGSSTLAGTSSTLAAFAYGRDAEREADAAGLEMLAGAGIDATGLAAFLERIQAEEGALSENLGFFSTHPATSERIAMVRENASGGDPAMTPENWKALLAICEN